MLSVSHIANNVDRFMRRIEAGVHIRAKSMDVDRVGPLGGMVLLTLQETEPAPVQKLVGELRRDKSQMTRIIQMLEKRGYVMRNSCPVDGRVSLLGLTEKGRLFVGEIEKIMSEVVEEILSPLSAEERDVFARLLEKV